MSYLSVILADSPVGVWMLNEPSGTNSNDETANANDGTYAGSTYTQAQTGGLTGYTATSFSGTSARVWAPPISAYNLGTTFSVEAWVKRTRTATNESIVVRNGDQTWRLDFSPSDYIAMAQIGTANGFRSTTTLTDTTNWHHIVVTNAGATHVVWLDGADAGLYVDAATSFGEYDGNIEIGNSVAGTYLPFAGLIQGVAIYPTALTSGQVAAHYAAADDGAGAAPPVWVSPADTVSMGTTPVLVFTSPTSASAQHFHLQLDTANTFDTGNLRELRTNVDQTGWEFWDGDSWEAFPSGGLSTSYDGNDVRHTVQSALSAATWYRRVRAGV